MGISPSRGRSPDGEGGRHVQQRVGCTGGIVDVMMTSLARCPTWMSSGDLPLDEKLQEKWSAGLIRRTRSVPGRRDRSVACLRRPLECMHGLGRHAAGLVYRRRGRRVAPAGAEGLEPELPRPIRRRDQRGDMANARSSRARRTAERVAAADVAARRRRQARRIRTPRMSRRGRPDRQALLRVRGRRAPPWKDPRRWSRPTGSPTCATRRRADHRCGESTL